jgi:cytochrome c-type biogenesis protein CcmH/NrfG
LIWIALVAVVFVAGGAWLIAKSTQMRLITLGLGVAGVAAYWFVGQPGLEDQPLSSRIEMLEMADQASPESTTPEQYLAIRQERARKAPNDPAPFKEIGDLYLANGRMEEAMSAYRSALQRDPRYTPAADAIAEMNFMATGEVDDITRQSLPAIRARAQANPEDLTSVQVLALIEDRLSASPEDVTAFRMQGDILASVGQMEKAEAAYRSALKYAPKDRLTLEAWADARFKATQKVDQETTDLYLRAYRLDTSDLRLGYMAGIGLWLQDKKGEAEKLWATVNARAPENGTERQMFAALRQMFGIDPPSSP